MRRILRKTFSYPVLLGSVLIFWIILRASSAVWDSDFWFHMRNVEYLIAHGSTPHVDLYSYTTNSFPYMVHQWLAEIPFYLAWRGGGLLGIYVLFTSLLIAIHLGIWWWAYAQSGNLKSSFLVAFFSAFLTSVSFGPRTLLFSYIYLLILLLILGRYRATGKSALWAIPPLFCLWINCHGTWLLGMVILGIYIVSGMVEGRWGRVEANRWTPQQLRKLVIAAGVSFAALFVNPFGGRLVSYPFEMAFLQKLNVAYTDEWASVDFNQPLGIAVFILLAVILLGILASRHTWRLEETLLMGLALYSGLMHIRFLFLAAILMAPMLAKMLDVILPYRREADRPVLNAVVVAVVFLCIIPFVPGNDGLQRNLEKHYPVRAMNFFKTQGLSGNIFNRYMWGGYLIGCCPGAKTFIDTRADIFEYAGVMQDYLDIKSLKGSLRILDKYQVRYVLVTPEDPLAYLLKNNKGWKVRYTDNVAVILQRVSPEPATIPSPFPSGAPNQG